MLIVWIGIVLVSLVVAVLVRCVRVLRRDDKPLRSDTGALRIRQGVHPSGGKRPNRLTEQLVASAVQYMAANCPSTTMMLGSLKAGRSIQYDYAVPLGLSLAPMPPEDADHAVVAASNPPVIFRPSVR